MTAIRTTRPRRLGAAVAILLTATVACSSGDDAQPEAAPADPAPEAIDEPAPPERSVGAPVDIPAPGPDAVAQVGLDGLLPADRQAVWQPGLTAVGGIPHRTDVCADLAPSGGDDTAAIQAALDACPAGQVVQLGDGTYEITGDGLELRRSGVTLRGNGPERTHLVKQRGTEFPVAIIGTRWLKFTEPTEFAAGAAQGARRIELASDPGLWPGETVIVDQLETSDLTRWHPDQAPGDPSRGWFNRQDRPIGQVVEVKAVQATQGNGGVTVELTTPLHLAYPLDRTPQLIRFGEDPGGEVTPRAAVRGSGIEDLHVQGGEGGDGGGNIHLFGAAYSWVRNVESDRSDGGSVVLSACFRCEVRDSYLHSTVNPNPGGGGYGLVVNQHAADNLVENNMIWNFNKVMVMRATGGGNVIAYNYVEDGWIEYDPQWPESGLNASHFTTPHHELFEGNLGWNFEGESRWGNSIYITVFRNHLTGERRSVAPLDFPPDDDGFRRIVALQPGHWWYSFLGNVLGTDGMSSSRGFAEEWPGEEWTDNEPVYVWYLGESAYREEYYIADPQAEIDLVRERTLRHANFDFVTGEQHWDDDLDRQLPDSLYLTDKPAFFGDLPWPWVDPATGTTDDLPARIRFDQIHGL